MIAITRRERIYFAAVGILALWVGLWGYFIPGLVNWAIPWLVPPLHARFLGSMYLSGATFMAGCLLARRYAEVRVVVPMIAIWTGMLLIVSLFYLDQFDYTIPPTYIWFAAYIVYPLIALWLAWKHRLDREQLPGPALPGWARAYLAVQGAGAVLLAQHAAVRPRARTLDATLRQTEPQRAPVSGAIVRIADGRLSLGAASGRLFHGESES